MSDLELLQEWLTPSGFLEENEDLAWIFDKFLVSSLAVGVSARSEGFIRELFVTHSVEAEQIINDLLAGLIYEICDKTQEIPSWIEGHSDLFGQNDQEFYVFYRTEAGATRTALGELKEHKEVKVRSHNETATKNIERRFFELDALYRHIRNALAHGRFAISSQGKSISFIDLNSNENVSAVARLSIARLKRWYQYACTRAGKRL